MGGGNEEDNIVELTEEQHLMAHYLLCKIFPKHRGVNAAYRMMCNRKTVDFPTEDMKEEYAKNRREGGYWKGKKRSKSSVSKMRKSLKDYYRRNEGSMKGRNHTEDSIKKMSLNRRDSEVLTLIKGKDIIKGTRRELIEQLNLNPSNLSSVIKGRRRRIKGWQLIKH